MIVKAATGIYYQLVDKNGKDLNVGDKLRDFRGNHCILKAPCWPPAHSPGSARVTIGQEAPGYDRCVFPTVIGATWVPVTIESFDDDRR